MHDQVCLSLIFSLAIPESHWTQTSVSFQALGVVEKEGERQLMSQASFSACWQQKMRKRPKNNFTRLNTASQLCEDVSWASDTGVARVWHARKFVWVLLGEDSSLLGTVPAMFRVIYSFFAHGFEEMDKKQTVTYGLIFSNLRMYLRGTQPGSAFSACYLLGP